MKRTSTIISITAISVVVLLVSILPAFAQQAEPGATRSFDKNGVAPGGQVTVTIAAADYGSFGAVTETLPDGFSYVSSSLGANEVSRPSGQTVRFILQGVDKTFTYMVTASSVAGEHSFSGKLRDSDRGDHDVGGESRVTVFAQQSEPSATRSFDKNRAAPGGRVTVTIAAADYGSFGAVTETLPDGFSYVSSSLGASEVSRPSGQTVRFTLQGADKTFTYMVTASSVAGEHSFSGKLRDSDRGEHDVGGESRVTVTGRTLGCATGGAVSNAANNPGLVSDCDTLLASRDTLAGTATLNWSAGTPIGDWDGIGDDSLEGTPARVTRLYLSGMGLAGSIPTDLGSLSALRELYLHDNELTGSIPSSLGDLSNLTSLYVYNNDLTGNIPAKLGELAALKRLYLYSNDLTGSIPAELGKLTKLTQLFLRDNDLTGEIPAELGNMSSLDWLNIAENDISGGIPAELGRLARLRRLYVSENDLSGPIPGELGDLPRLTHIVAQENDLSGELPPELGKLTNLVWLGLHDNDLEGGIPAELGGLAKLQRLYLHHNELSGEIPKELGDLSALTNLWLNNNYLSGQIPGSLGGLTKLSRLRLASNSFTGCLPAGLAAVGNSDADQLGLETCQGS